MSFDFKMSIWNSLLKGRALVICFSQIWIEQSVSSPSCLITAMKNQRGNSLEKWLVFAVELRCRANMGCFAPGGLYGKRGSDCLSLRSSHGDFKLLLHQRCPTPGWWNQVKMGVGNVQQKKWKHNAHSAHLWLSEPTFGLEGSVSLWVQPHC